MLKSTALLMARQVTGTHKMQSWKQGPQSTLAKNNSSLISEKENVNQIIISMEMFTTKLYYTNSRYLFLVE